MKKILVLTVMSVILLVAPSMASDPYYPSQADSAYIGVFIPRTSIEGDIKGVDDGTGVGGRIGFSVEKVLSSEFSVFKTRHDAASGERLDLTGITLDIKLSLPLFPVVSPYGLVGLGRYTLESPQTVYRGNTDSNGINGYQEGLGLDLYLSKTFCLNLGYTMSRMKFDTGTPGAVTLKATAKTYDLGLTVHF